MVSNSFQKLVTSELWRGLGMGKVTNLLFYRTMIMATDAHVLRAFTAATAS